MQEKNKTGLLLLGCPQVPIQTSAALYLSWGLHRTGVISTIAGTKAARALVEVADPEKTYYSRIVDLDEIIGLIAEGEEDFDCSFIFIHNDSGLAYAATLAEISEGTVWAIIFGDSAEELASSIVPGIEVIAAKGSHNPLPIRRKIDGVLEWVASNL
jgi:hypothetical protein